MFIFCSFIVRFQTLGNPTLCKPKGFKHEPKLALSSRYSRYAMSFCPGGKNCAGLKPKHEFVGCSACSASEKFLSLLLCTMLLPKACASNIQNIISQDSLWTASALRYQARETCCVHLHVHMSYTICKYKCDMICITNYCKSITNVSPTL